jgi:Kef-type K+ transport system membrane component KefB
MVTTLSSMTGIALAAELAAVLAVALAVAFASEVVALAEALEAFGLAGVALASSRLISSTSLDSTGPIDHGFVRLLWLGLVLLLAPASVPSDPTLGAARPGLSWRR